jgi:methylmalonyl-CoA mutase
MNTPAQAEPLLSQFPAHSYEQWHQAAEALLKGDSFEKVLLTRTYEDITIQPIYRHEDIETIGHRNHLPGTGSLVRGSHAGGFLKAGWEVSQEIHACCPGKFNRIAHEGLERGQSELNIAVACPGAEAPTACSGLLVENLADLRTALNDIAIDAISIFWRSGSNSLPLAALYYATARQSGIDSKNLRGCFDNDPFSELVTSGSLRQSLTTRFDHIGALTHHAREHSPGVRTITVHGDVYHNSGATATQELAYVIATLVCYIEEMKERGLSPESVFPHVRICLAVGSDFFMEIAKIRAARLLWSRIAAAYGVESAPVHIHASTSKWNKTRYDAHTNMLRVTSEAFAAVVAGVDSMHIGPYDEISGHTDEFSRRIASNVHAILREECGLDHVIDPAGGSSYIEWLTDQIASSSWKIFQDIETRGGMLACIENGSVQEAVEAVAQAKFQNIRRRKDKIVGCNRYPDLKGGGLEPKSPSSCNQTSAAENDLPAIGVFDKDGLIEQAVTAALNGATTSQIVRACGVHQDAPPLEVTPLKACRAAEEYEGLRDASIAFAARTGAAPAILQLNIGPSGAYRLRADWTTSFFETAGFVVDSSRDFADVSQAVNALVESPAGIAVITSDDATYLEVVAPIAVAAKAARPEITLLVAGAPGDSENNWRSAGVDEFVNVRSNNFELNEQLLNKAGVL